MGLFFVAIVLLLLQWDADKRLLDKEGLTPDLLAQNILISRLISTFNDINESPSSSSSARHVGGGSDGRVCVGRRCMSKFGVGPWGQELGPAWQRGRPAEVEARRVSAEPGPR